MGRGEQQSNAGHEAGNSPASGGLIAGGSSCGVDETLFPPLASAPILASLGLRMKTWRALGNQRRLEWGRGYLHGKVCRVWHSTTQARDRTRPEASQDAALGTNEMIEASHRLLLHDIRFSTLQH